MGLMDGKTALVFGVANQRSIAWGITEALHREGAKIGLSYAGEVLKKRVLPLAESIGSDFVEPCDVTKDEELDSLFAKARERFGKIDALIHAVAFANQEDLKDQFVTTSRAGFHLAMDISVYSLVAMAQRAKALMTTGGSIITMTYYGSEKVMPHYNVMGVAKAALEASVRYLASDLGELGIRVNGFRDMLRFSEQAAPLKRNVSIEDVGNTALWLCSDLASAITGETIYVDAGINIMGISLAMLGKEPAREESAG